MENRGSALSPSGKVCLELQHRPGVRTQSSLGALSACIGASTPALIHPESAALCWEPGIWGLPVASCRFKLFLLGNQL